MRIEEVIGHFYPLQRAGANWLIRCPFHDDNRPSCFISPSKGIFKCFVCDEGGDAITFLKLHEKFTYTEAMRWLADFYHIPFEEVAESPEHKAEMDARKQAHAQLELECDNYRTALHSEAGSEAMHYLRQRGISERTITDFELGYGGATGFFHDRIIFPIRDKSNRCVGFGGRVFNKEDQRKYLNSPESDIYRKSHLLYGLHLAKGAITKHKMAYLVEGYTDVMAMHQAGITHAVGTCGTALTSAQVRLLHRFTNRVTICFDGDAAGQKATARALEILLEGGMVVDVVKLPDGVDPEEYLQREDTAVDSLHQDFVSYLLADLTGDADVPTRVAIQKTAAKTIARIPDSLYREEYAKDLATKTKRPVEVVQQEVSTYHKALSQASGNTATNLVDTDKTTLSANETALLPYAGSYPLHFDVPVPQTWLDAWKEVDAQMHALGNTAQTWCTLEAEIICTLIAHGSATTNDMTVKQWITYDLSDDDLKLEIPVLQEAFEVLIGTVSESSTACQELMHSIETALALWDRPTHSDGESEVQVHLLVEQLMIKYKTSIAHKRRSEALRAMQEVSLDNDEMRELMEVVKRWNGLIRGAS